MLAVAVFAVVLLVAYAIALRAQNPRSFEIGIMQDPARRKVVVGLYILSGPWGFLAQCANDFTNRSTRYGASVLDLPSLTLLIGVALTISTVALHMAWLVFGVHSFGTFDYFPPDRDVMARLPQVAVFLLSAAYVLYIVADWSRIEAKVGQGFIYVIALLPILPNLMFFQNTGLSSLLFGAVIARSGGKVMALMTGLIFVSLGRKAGADLAMVCAFAAVSGTFAWLVLRATVEALASAWWYQWGSLSIILAVALSVLLGLAALIAAPFAAFLLLDLLAPLSPDTFMAGWPQLSARFLAGGTDIAVTAALAGSAALVPTVGYLIFGMGAAFGNRMPRIDGFRTKLRAAQGSLTSAQMSDIIADRRAAYFMGYLAATVLSLAVAGGLLALATSAILHLH